MRLLLIEDEDDFAQALVRALRQHGYAIDHAADGIAGWQLAVVNDYDLLILDLNLPKLHGFAVCQRIKADKPAMRVLVLTARGDLPDRVKGLDLGADDYVIKPFHLAELLARIRALLRRDVHGQDPCLRFGDVVLDPVARVVWQGQTRLNLTSKELGILEYLLHHPGEIIRQEELLEHVWDMNANLLTNTVRVHINALRRKLHDDAEAPRYIATVINQGYRLGPPKEVE